MSTVNNVVLALFVSLALIPSSAVAANHAGHGSHGSGHESHGHAAHAPASNHRIYTTQGLVEAVDAAEGKLTITHEPIVELGWPIMTMGFAVESPDLLAGIAAGDRVRLDFRNEQGVSIIVDMEIL